MNVYVNVSPIKLGFRSNSERGFIMILRDITKEKSLEEERDEFISVVSHELRTPITISEAEISNAQLINSRQGNDEKLAKALESAHKQVVFLANMMNDLATLSRAQRDDYDIELAVIDPKEILQGLANNYTVEAKQKNLEFITKIEGSVRTVVSSKLYVEEILQNFVTNSLKYTREGSVTVVASQQPTGIMFSVIDTGIGISKTDQHKLFEKFFRSEDYRTRESGGTGLGLYVTLKLAKRIGAKITVQSELNHGSTFHVIVPSAQSKAKRGHEVTTSEMGQFIDQV
jgi:two-component system phosphate regulon sensor histidine kinase PhoR